MIVGKRTELTRMVASRALRSVAFLLAALAAGGAAAATPALVVEADSGKVLYAERATDPWFPASITKLMTVYVALGAVREGKLSMDTLLTVSENAAAQPPSKMGFRPGTEITLDNALKIIMVKSANDVSTTIAEGIGGTVEGFAAMMNATARRLGMHESNWTNPHGLPDPAQYTTARDMAILGRALIRDFPQHQGLFQLSAIKLGRRVMANHNGLIGRYPGADGMKTGFICSSGFNVVASATRDGRRLITVVMGSRSAAERTIKAADLFDRGFATASSFFSFGGRTVEDLPRSFASAAPDMRPYICGGRGPMPSEEDSAAVQANAANAENPISFAAPGFSSALAFAGGSVAAGPRKLGPRAPLQPVLVWTGRAPNTNIADNEEPTPRRKKGRKALAAKPAAKPVASPAAEAFVAAKPAAIMDAGTGAKLAVTPAAALAKPVPLAKPAAGKPAAPAKKAAAKAAPTGAKPAAVAPKAAAAAAKVTAKKQPAPVKQTVAAKPKTTNKASE
jgi:D-alanyl-D-alanine carboxypeptidase